MSHGWQWQWLNQLELWIIDHRAAHKNTQAPLKGGTLHLQRPSGLADQLEGLEMLETYNPDN